MQDFFEEIKSKINTLPSPKEENVKNHIVVPHFLQKLGYTAGTFDFEKKVYDDLSDITYLENGKPLMVIETKGLYNKITNGDGKQLIDYLISRETRTVWGLLSNGIEYYLFNDDIPGLIDDKIVFHISINQKSDQRYLKYFSYENIFVNKTTNFFANITRFEMYWRNAGYNENSLKMYRSTLYNFFEFYSQNHDYSSFGKSDIECLCQIQIDDFFAFIRKKNEDLSQKRCNKDRSYQTLTNNYRHLRTFFETLKVHGDIPHHNFIYSETDVLKAFRNKISPKDKHIIDAEAYQLILEHLSKGRNSSRNIAIFMFCSYYGMKRSTVNKLTWDSINFGKNTITVEKRKYKMTELMSYCLQNLYKERRKQRLKCNEVFTNPYIKGGKRLSEGAINDIFYSLRKINAPNCNLEWLCPEKVRECLIQNMFECGYSMESIVYFTGLDVSSVANCISYNRIIDIGKNRLEKPRKHLKHPFQDVVDSFFNAYIKGKAA